MKYEQELIESWEANYKQGQLTLWIFLALHQSPKTVKNIQEYLDSSSNSTMTADDKSLYRALRKYIDTNMVDSTQSPSDKGGPPVKVYSLTGLGSRVLEKFIKRNITVIVNNYQIKELL